MYSETSDITTLELRTSDIPIADLQTSNISTAEIWQAVANQWARGEGRAVLLKPEEYNRATSARDHPHTSDSDDDPPLGKQLAKLSIDEPSPEEKIYFEKVLSRNGVMCLAYAKSLPSPSEPCAHMVTADKQLCGQTAYFSRADEDLSLLVGYDCGWIFRLFEGVMGISDSFSTRLGAETQDGSSEAATHRPPSVRQQHTGIRTVVRPLALSHPAIRKSMTSVELGIHVPIKRDFTRFDKTSRTEVVDEVLFSKVTSQLKRRLLSLSNDLASFENLKFLRIVLVGWGRGDLQSFKEGGIVAEYVLPFFDLLDVGICLGIQVQMVSNISDEHSPFQLIHGLRCYLERK